MVATSVNSDYETATLKRTKSELFCALKLGVFVQKDRAAHMCKKEAGRFIDTAWKAVEEQLILII